MTKTILGIHHITAISVVLADLYFISILVCLDCAW